MTFSTSVDIANRACQHVGVTRIADFTEDSLQAGELSFCYDKLRRAELRRNVWRFAIKRAPLRPMTTTTMFIQPSLWASTTTYGFGAIVQDSGGLLWQSKIQINLNNSPGNAPSSWDMYCGPLTSDVYDDTGTTGYYTGEIVYESPGDGSYTAYMSLANDNSQDPRVQALWVDTTQYYKTQVVVFYAAWAIGTTYSAGDVITYSSVAYVSLQGSNTGNEPDTATTYWTALPTTLAPDYYDSATAYIIGNFVTYGGANYVCILASTGNLPTNVTYWVAVGTGTTYSSLIELNLNNDPSSAPALWASGTTYAATNRVGASDGYIYTSDGNGNIGHDPATTTGYWTNTGTLNPWTTVNPYGTAADQWVTLALTLKWLQIAYPIGTGPTEQTTNSNVFRLPANFLRRAPQNPKAGSVSFLGSPTGIMYDDWLLEGDYIVSQDVYPIVLRFVADITDVTAMDDMFCEGLAARMGLETCERLTQSTAKMAGINNAYSRIMTEARTVNGIETGSVEPPEDDYITCRI